MFKTGFIADLRESKKKLLIVAALSLILAVLPFAAFLSVRGQPAGAAPETVLFSYEHQGRFDYLVYLKPSYLFGPASWEPPTTPRYPASIVDTIDFTFTYQPAESAAVWGSIDAILENPGVWQKTVRLVTGSTGASDLTLHFPIDVGYFEKQFEDIERTLNISGQSRSLTIKASVEGGGTQFVQSLPVRFDGGLVEVGSELQLARPSGVGGFDYIVHLKSGTGGRIFPAEIVDSVDFTCAFSSNTDEPISGSIEAVIENPGVWQKSVMIARSTAAGPNITLTVPVNLETILGLFTDIEKETGITTPDRSLTIRTDVMAGEKHFVQTLPVRLSPTLIEIDGNLKRTEPFGSGSMSYTLHFKPNSIYGGDRLTVPDPSAASEPVSGVSLAPAAAAAPVVTVRPGEAVFPKLIDRMDMTYSYRLGAEKPVGNVVSEVTVDAAVEAPNLWSKKFRLLDTKKAGDFSLNFPVEIGRYSELIEAVRAETGVSSESYDINVTVNVHATAETGAGKIDEMFTQNLKGTIKGSVLEWGKELAKNQPGAIKQTKVTNGANGYLGLTASQVQIITLSLAVVFLIVFGGALFLLLTGHSPAAGGLTGEAAQIRKKYGNRIAEAVVQTPVEGEKVISLGSINDLVSVSDELGKPIIHQVIESAEVTHAYFVFDGTTRYQYVIGYAAEEEPEDI